MTDLSAPPPPPPATIVRAASGDVAEEGMASVRMPLSCVWRTIALELNTILVPIDGLTCGGGGKLSGDGVVAPAAVASVAPLL